MTKGGPPPPPPVVDGPPPAVTGLTFAGRLDWVRLFWTEPTVADYARTIVRLRNGATPPTWTTGVEAFSGKGSSYILYGLDPGITVSFTVWTEDTTGHRSAARSGTVRGTDITLTASAAAVRVGGKVTFTAKLRDAATAHAVTGTVSLFLRSPGSARWSWWKDVTVSGGTWRGSYLLRKSVEVMVKYAGTTNRFGAEAGPVRVSVR